MNLIVESQYFPPLILFKLSIGPSYVQIDLYERWQKTSFRNRCMVAGANGPILLSVPILEGREQRGFMQDIKIDNRKKWQSLHWKTIVSCYNRSPWFSYYSDELEALFEKEFGLLVEWNAACFNWVVRKLGLSLESGFTREPVPGGSPAFEDLRNKILPRSINERFPNPVKYYQVFEDRIGFIPNLSILDLLFCEGKNAAALLRSA